jgi:hypothetical protein
MDPSEQSARELQIERAKAIEAYAKLEQALCSLFAAWLNIKPEIAALVFFKITNASARLDILDLLFEKQSKSEYSSTGTRSRSF